MLLQSSARRHWGWRRTAGLTLALFGWLLLPLAGLIGCTSGCRHRIVLPLRLAGLRLAAAGGSLIDRIIGGWRPGPCLACSPSRLPTFAPSEGLGGGDPSC